MPENSNRKIITLGFNIVLFVYIIFASFVSCLFDPQSENRVPMDTFYDFAPVTSIVVAVLLAIIFILTGALIIRAFWNRLIVSLFSIREINYQESLTIILVVSMFTV